MSIAGDYLVRGLTVSDIADNKGMSRDEVVDALREAGIAITNGQNIDSVTLALRQAGYLSFDSYVLQGRMLAPINRQAKHLGVTRHALAGLYDAYRAFIAASPRGE